MMTRDATHRQNSPGLAQKVVPKPTSPPANARQAVHCNAAPRAHLRDLPALVVAAQKRHVRGVARLEQHEQREHLQAVEAAVHKVAHEDIVGGGHLAARLKQLEQVMELAMNVAADLRTRPAAEHSPHTLQARGLLQGGDRGAPFPRLPSWWGSVLPRPAGPHS